MSHVPPGQSLQRNSALVVGLVGGIGSGKSAAAAAFARHGARVIVADELGHLALRQPELKSEVVRRWGKEVLDANGEIDRRRLADIVFRSEQERRALEALVHPWIGRRVEEEITRAQTDRARLIVVDAALLLEADWHAVCDRIVFVDAPIEVRRQRVMLNRGWKEEHWQDRERAQLPLTEKRARADHVLNNSSNLEHLNRQVDDLMHLWGLVPVSESVEVPPSRHGTSLT